jgi:hypothetical protein
MMFFLCVESSSKFHKSLLDIDAIASALSEAVTKVHQTNPKVQVIFTVSPVRHAKEGIPENSLSKAILLCAVHQLIQTKPSLMSYFPSYEIFLDELR